MVKKTDLLLFNSLKSGQQGAFKEVYQGNRELFLNYGRKYNLTDPDILDIYQDAYIAFYENIVNGRLTELTSAISTYIISIGKYMIMDMMRKNKKKVEGNVSLEQVNYVDEEITTFDIYTEEITDEEKLLANYLEKLGEKCRAILILFYYKKYSIKDIMAAGNYNSENVVKSQKSRCLKTLKELFKDSEVSI